MTAPLSPSPEPLDLSKYEGHLRQPLVVEDIFDEGARVEVCLVDRYEGREHPIVFATLFHDTEDDPQPLVSQKCAEATARLFRDAPLLLAEVERLRAEIADLRKSVDTAVLANKLYQEQNAALRDDAQRKWHPIETCPKDGTPIWLLLSNGVQVKGEYWSPLPEELDRSRMQGWAYDATSELLYEGRNPDTFDFEPSHWQPLVSQLSCRVRPPRELEMQAAIDAEIARTKGEPS